MPCNETTALWTTPVDREHLPSGGEGSSYIGYLTRRPLLTAEEEITLANKIRTGDTRAKGRLVEANMRLVINIAKGYHCPLVPFEDLVQEGAIGLMTACERFDPSRGFRFSTYATHWIRQAISRAIDNKSRSIRVPAHISESLRKIERTRAELRREYEGEPTTEEIASRLNMKPRKVALCLAASQEPVSLDIFVGAEENSSLGSILSDIDADDPEETIIRHEELQELNKILESLTDREQTVMRLRLGFDGEEARVLQDIGENMSISRERVRQIETQALAHLRALARRKKLREYLSE